MNIERSPAAPTANKEVAFPPQPLEMAWLPGALSYEGCWDSSLHLLLP